MNEIAKCNNCEDAFNSKEINKCEGCNRELCRKCIVELESSEKKCVCAKRCVECTDSLLFCNHCKSKGCVACWKTNCHLCKESNCKILACNHCMGVCDNCQKFVCKSHCYKNENLIDGEDNDICVACVEAAFDLLNSSAPNSPSHSQQEKKRKIEDLESINIEN